jgi:hypothetical protein
MADTVNRHTRAGRNGRPIECPHCQYVATVRHFAWAALQCTACHRMIEKGQWLIALR